MKRATNIFGLVIAAVLSVQVPKGVSGETTQAIFNAEQWIAVHADHNPNDRRPPPASQSWKDANVEIFVSIADYRDKRCPETLKNIFNKAINPKRIYVGKNLKHHDFMYVAEAYALCFPSCIFQVWSNKFIQKMTIWHVFKHTAN
jgi:hypothetical protein